VTIDERGARRLLVVAGAVAVLGVLGFVMWGGDRPEDPVFEAAPSSTAGTEPSTTATTATPETTGTTPGATTTLPGDPARVPLPGFDEVAITVQPADGGSWLAWCLLAARTADQRSRGLMEVTDLQGYSGMAFLYDQDVENAFYMRNTPTPLSIAWIDAEGQLVSTADMAPCEDRDGCPTYPPGGPYRTAIEVFQGGLDDLGITEGATIQVGGACAPVSSSDA
jgi:uncharacterized membrane protein (UPF0127 family)